MADGMRKAPGRTAGVLVMAAVVAGVVGFLIAHTGAMPGPSPPPLVTGVPFGPVSGPGYTAADDPAAGQIVVFGGVDTYGTTWVWEGGHWALARPGTSPPGRSAATSAYDPVTRTVMLYGGQLQRGEMVDDTWSWNGDGWRELDAGAGHPPSSGVIAWDSSLNEMVLVAGPVTNSTYETWEWTGSRWKQDSDGDFVGYGTALAFDPISRTLIAVTSSGPDESSTVTLQWQGSAWHRMQLMLDPTIAAHPSATVAALALDPMVGRLLLTCAAAGPGAASDEWIWDGTKWTLAAAVQLPASSYAEIADPRDARTLLIGSLVPTTPEAPELIHIWAWDGAAWRRQDLAAASSTGSR